MVNALNSEKKQHYLKRLENINMVACMTIFRQEVHTSWWPFL